MKGYYLLLVVVFSSVTLGCQQKKEPSVVMNKEMKPQHDLAVFYRKEIEQLKGQMIEYRRWANNPYPESVVNQVEEILNDYFENIEHSTSKTEGVEIIKATVEQLNVLNEEWDLISTDGREVILDIILEVSEAKEYTKKGEDITEAWRMW
ncbi:hypothetical protein [Myroides sp. DW712]|uniref:hypothetical protein n=1 Tax=Myroides sp. DW712 TaxID=3389800 RepID=UPI003979A410